MTTSDDKHPPRIAETPQFKDADTHIKLARAVVKWGPRFRPLLRLFGVDVSSLDKSVTNIAASLPEFERLVDIPDRFNTLFASLGWIASSVMSMEVMIKAVELGEGGDFKASEDLLVEQFTAEHLGWHLMRLGTLEHFYDRRELAQLILVDYVEGRYHAVVPNLLMMIDGLASDASGSNESFFSERADLRAWNLIEGHPSGLPALSRLMQQSRMKRRTEELGIPYRHGILHGRDLGFANKLVASKCWAALIAVGEWARAVANGKKVAPPPTPQLGLLDSLRKLSETIRRGERIKNWQPRDLTPGKSVPAAGPSTAYAPGTPERALAEFLELWQRRNYGGMAELVAIGVNKVDPRTRAGDINRMYRDLTLAHYEFAAIQERGPMATHFSVACTLRDGDTATFGFILVFENDDGDYLHDDMDQGTWRIVNWPVVGSYTRLPDD